MLVRIMLMGLLLFCIAPNSWGQQNKLDSLLNVLENYKREDTGKAKLLLRIAANFNKIDPNKSINYSTALIKLAEANNFTTALIDGKNELGKSYYYLGDVEKALSYYKEANAIALVIKDENRMATSLLYIGNVNQYKSKDIEAIKYFKLAITKFEKLKDIDGMARTYGNLSISYTNQADFSNAIYCSKKTIELFNSLKKYDQIGYALDGLTHIYLSMKDYKTALQYATQCISVLDKYHFDFMKPRGYFHKGQVLEEMGQTDSAYYYYNYVYKEAKKVGDYNTWIMSIVAIADKKVTNKEYISAFNDYFEALQYNLKEEDLESISECYNKLGDLSQLLSKNELIELKTTNTNPVKLASLYFDSSLFYGLQNHNYIGIKNAYLKKSKLNESIKDYMIAYDNYKNYILYKDSALNEDKKNEFNKAILKYEYSKKEDSLKLIQASTDATLQQQSFLNRTQQQSILLQDKELLLNKQTLFSNNQQLVLLNKDKELQHLAYLKTQADLQTTELLKTENEKQLTIVQKEKLLQSSQVKTLSQENELNKLKQRQLLFYSITGLATLLFAGLYLFNRNRAKQAQLKVELEKKEAEFQRSLADVSMSALRSQMNPHFIFNCLNSIKLYTTQNDTVAAANYLTKFSKLIRMALENSRSETVTLDAELQSLELYIQMEAMRFKEKLKYSITIDKNVDSSFIEIPPMLLQPYVENAIWHGLMHKEEGGLIDITVQVMPNEHTLAITIKDNGVGREKAAQLKSKSAIAHKSFGTKVTSERLDLINQIYKTGASVHTDDVMENGMVAGTLVTILIPFE